MYAHTETPAGSVLNMPDVLLRPHRACARTHHNRFPSPPQHSHCASRQRRALDRATQIAPGSRPAQRGTLNSARARDRHSAESATGRCRRERSSAPRHCRWPERATHAPRRSHGAFAARCAPTDLFLAQATGHLHRGRTRTRGAAMGRRNLAGHVPLGRHWRPRPGGKYLIIGNHANNHANNHTCAKRRRRGMPGRKPSGPMAANGHGSWGRVARRGRRTQRNPSDDTVTAE